MLQRWLIVLLSMIALTLSACDDGTEPDPGGGGDGGSAGEAGQGGGGGAAGAGGMAGGEAGMGGDGMGGDGGMGGDPMGGMGGEPMGGMGGGMMGEPCSLDEPCEEGEICVLGFCEPAPDDCMVDEDCVDGVCGEGQCVSQADVCEMPTPIAAGEELRGSNATGPGAAAGSCAGNGRETLYSFTPEAAGTFCASTLRTPRTADTSVYIRTTCDDPETEIGCNDDAEVDQFTVNSAVEFEAEAGTTYYVFVDSFGLASSGDFILEMLEGPCPEVLPPECDEEHPCPIGFCVLDPPEGQQPFCAECLGDENCEEGVCEQNSCVECRDDDQCGEGVCFETACVECVESGDCADGLCFEFQCVDCIADGDCADGEFCVANTCEAGVAAGVCDAPVAISLGERIVSSTSGVEPVHEGSCGNAQQGEAVFVHEAEADGLVCFQTTGTGFDTVLYLRSECANPEAELACNDDDFGVTGGVRSAITLEVTAGESYFAFVDGFGEGEENTNSGGLVLNLTEGACGTCEEDGDCIAEGRRCLEGRCVVPPCEEDEDCFSGVCVEFQCVDCRDQEDCDEGFCVENACVECRGDDDCEEGVCGDGACVECVVDDHCPDGQRCFGNQCRENAVPQATCEMPNELPIGQTLVSSTEGAASSEGGTCGGTVSPEVVFAIELEANSPVCVSTAGSEYDTVMHARTDCADPETELDCNDDNFLVAGGVQSAFTLNVEEPGTVFVFVDGFDGFDDVGRAGFFSITATAGECGTCEVDDDCLVDGQACLGGVCGVPQCEDDDGCFGGVCLDRRCVDCRENGDCGDDGLCIENTCVECEQDDQCGEGVCVENFCRQCRENPDCDEGLCLENRCVECIENADCAAGFCVENACVECREDADCGPGFTCFDAVCEPLPDLGTCEEPDELNIGEVIFGSTDFAPSRLDASCGGAAASGDAVYSFLSQREGEICVSLAGSQFDTVLHVRTDPCVNGVDDEGNVVRPEVLCDDDGGPGNTSAATLATEPGVRYFVVVDGFGENSRGAYRLATSDGPCMNPEAVVCFGDDDCVDGVCAEGVCAGCREDGDCEDGFCVEARCLECREDADCAEGDTCVAGDCQPPPLMIGTCEAPAAIEGFGRYLGSTEGAEDNHQSCPGDGGESVLSLTLPRGGPVCLDTFGSGYDTTLYVRTACGDAETELACNDDTGGVQSQIGFAAEADTPYFVFMDGFAGEGDFVLNVTPGECPPPPEPDFPF